LGVEVNGRLADAQIAQRGVDSYYFDDAHYFSFKTFIVVTDD
jgi:hypothetical protein